MVIELCVDWLLLAAPLLFANDQEMYMSRSIQSMPVPHHNVLPIPPAAILILVVQDEGKCSHEGWFGCQN